MNPSNRTLLVLILLFLCLSPLLAQQKPNIIFILTDDQRWDALGYAGNKVIHTPEMDRLAKEGVYFKNAFVTTPICAASRASILTGMYERTHGYTFGQGDLKEEFVELSYPVQLKQSGYYTGFFGKFGVNYAGFDQMFDVGDSYDRNGKFNDRRGYFYKTIGQDTVHLTRYTGHQAIEFINQAPDDRPFCLSLSFSAPHAHDPAVDQYFYQDEFNRLYEGIEIEKPIMAEDRFFEAQPDYVKTGENRTRWHWRYDDPDKYQKSIKGYYRMISEVDAEIGKIRTALETKGLDKNTVIIFMGDNGYFLGERQLAGKWLMYDNSLRVPLIIFDPRTPQPRDVEDMALNIDIAATLLDFAELDIPKAWQGLSLASYAKGENPLQSRQEFICEHLWEVDIIAPSEGIRTKNWKYFRYRNDSAYEELYDLDKDPLEKKNLVGNQRYAAKLLEMRQKFDHLAQRLENVPRRSSN
jgi:arylsulfatase A-like enzyme